MKKKWLFLSICLLGISVLSYFGLTKFRREEHPRKLQHVKAQQASYFDPVSITKFTAADQPCLPIQMNEKTITIKLDLGFRGDFGFKREFLAEIPEKKYLGLGEKYGFRGNVYKEKLYEGPKITIGNMVFSQGTLEEEAEQFSKDSFIGKEGQEPSPDEIGRVGWELFRIVNLFLDLKNSKIAFCDSLATLGQQGYSIETFVKTPLLSNRGFVEFDAMTPSGLLRCSLDTGSTWNILNTELEAGKTIEQMAWDPNNVSKFLEFKIEGVNFGEMAFHRIPVNIPIHDDATLGMEFFKEHLVFLDFYEGQIYIAPAPSDPQM